MRTPGSLKFLIVAIGGLATAVAACLAGAAPGVLILESELRAQPFSDAPSLAMLKRDLRIDIVRRDGGWIELSAGSDRGWVRALNVRYETPSMPSTRADPGIGTDARKPIPALTFDDEALRAVSPNAAALAGLAAYAASADDARKFALDAKLVPHEVPYIFGSQPRPFVRDRDRSAQTLPEEGAEVAAILLRAISPVADEAVQRYVNRVGAWLVQQTVSIPPAGADAAQAPAAGAPSQKWLFGVLDSAAVRGFAIPGNYVFLTRGLYDRLQNESELAAVLAREIGHILKGTFLGALRRQAAVLTYTPHLSTESDADRIGVVLAARAGYDAYGLTIFLANVAVETRVGAQRTPYAEREDALAKSMGTEFEQYADGKTLAARMVRLKN